MDTSGAYPAITAAIGGKQRRLSLEKQWRRAITNKELARDTIVQVDINASDSTSCRAGDVAALQPLFEEICGPEIQTPDVSPATDSEPSPAPEMGANGRAKVAQLTAKKRSAWAAPPSEQGLADPVMEARQAADVLPARQVAAKSDSETVNYVFLPLKRYADFAGRSSRREYWSFFAATFVGSLIGLVMIGVGGESPAAGVGVLVAVVWLALLIPSLAVTVRRLHDRDLSGWWLLGLFVAYLIPGINVLASIGFVILLLLPGTPGPNRFGEDPHGPSLASAFE